MDGIIIINKPKGITSFDVVRKLRKILREKKIGHTGTLDPLATGLMLICVGKATRLASDLEAENKTYKAAFDLGYATDTYDIEGKIIEQNDIKVEKEDLALAISKFIGDIKQIPPMYSALKVDGKKLYDLARKGIEIERKERDVRIDFINLLNFDNNKAVIETKVSKGTYIRSLIYDIGKALGTYATMTELIRTEVGKYELQNSYTLEEIEELKNENNFSFLKSVEEIFDFEKFNLITEKENTLFLNGNTIKLKENIIDGKYRIYYNKNFIGLAEVKNNLLKAYKYF